MPRDAGYREATAALSARTGVAVQPGSPDDPAVAREVADLLSRPITASVAARIALLHHPEVQAALGRVGVARGALVQAARLPNPEVDGALRFRGDGDPDVVLGASLDLRGLALLPARQGLAGGELSAAALEATGTAMDVAFEARMAFLDCLAADETLALSTSLAQAADAGADLAGRLDAAGNAVPLDALEQQATSEEAKLALARAQTARDLSRARLYAALGVGGDSAARLVLDDRLPPPTQPDPPADSVERTALDRSLELAIAARRQATSSSAASLARAEGLLPEVRAGVEAERTAELGGAPQWGVGPMVRVGLPLFDQGQGGVDAAESEGQRQRDLSLALSLQIRAEARALSLRVERARAEVEHYRGTLLPLRARIVEETLKGYNAMGASAFHLLAARRAELEAQQAYVLARHEYWSSRAALDHLLAGRLTQPLAHDFGLGVRTSHGAAGD